MALNVVSSDRLSTNVKTSNLATGLSGKVGENKNIIINGAMQVNQRVASAGLSDFNVVTGNLYTLDRWLGVGDSSFDWDSARIKQVSDSPDEFSNSLRVDIGNTETPSGSQNGVIVHRVEAQNLQHLAYGTSSAKSCTLSFWVRSNKTGTYCVQIQQEDASKYLLYEYSISSANTWEKKTITFSGNTANAITSDNGNGLEIDFHLACGSSDHVSATTSWTSTGVTGNKYLATSNQVNLWDHADNVWYITGVQLEVGDTATEFEHRSYGDELLRCQRYYYKVIADDNKRFCFGFTDNDDNRCDGLIPNPVVMRAVPTALDQTGTASNYGLRRDTSKTCSGVPTFNSATKYGIVVSFYKSGHGWGTASPVILSSAGDGAYLAWGAEL
jgi:hypothetical protein